MPNPSDNDLTPNPIRTGAAPTLDVPGAGLNTSRNLIQPAWFRMTEALVKVLRFHFSSATRIEHPDLTARVWTAAESSPIFISSLAEFAPTSGQQRPSVLVDRLDQELDTSKRAIGDQFQGGQPGQYAHLVVGRHVVHCLGGREGEAEILAFEVWRDLVRWSPILTTRLCLLRLLPTKVGKRVQLSGEHQEHYTVPIELTYGYMEQWRVYPTDEAEITAIRALTTTL